jgi:DNA repair photolyase
MKLEFQEYRTRKIVNVHRHVDGPWFWDRYSAHPYMGCRSGCEFCYLRGNRYLGRRDPDSFDSLIQVKTNAVERLRKELLRLSPDVIACGDWQQPAEERYRLSRGMLEVVCDLGFPLFILERSPLLTRDLDLLAEINRKTWVGVVLSVGSIDPSLKQAFEPRSPGTKRRFTAMERLASSGILVGTAMMPIIPFLGDGEDHLEDVIRTTKDHGGSFVMGGGLTMDGIQAQRSLEVVRRLDPTVEDSWRTLYQWKAGGEPQYGPRRDYRARLGRLVRELCSRHGLKDRMPRYVGSGPLAVNKRVAERLFLRTYDLELEEAEGYRVWAYRKAAWTVDDWSGGVGNLYEGKGEVGLMELPGIGKNLAREIGRWLRDDPSESDRTSQDGVA